MMLITLSRFLLLILLLTALPASAQTRMPQSVLAAGGADMADGALRLQGTLAQTAVGRPTSPLYAMKVGFWRTGPYVVGVDPDTPAYVWALGGAHPNPFNPRTTITYSLPTEGHVTLRIYSMRGELVRTLWDGDAAAGHHALPWDGRNDRGAGVASGVYLARIVSRHGVLNGKMVLTR